MSTYRSHAKINLFLNVLAKRQDGYHSIETIFQTVGLWDELRFSPGGSDVSLRCSSADVPQDRENLAVKAAMLIRERKRTAQGVHIDLQKGIPVAAGLAGGSGDAAATVLALNELWEPRLSEEKIRSIALELGSDVPYCTVGGTVAATGRGEVLRPLNPVTDRWFVLVHPPISVSTAWVYNHPSLTRRTLGEGRPTSKDFERAIGCVESGDIAGAVFNAMEEVVFSEYPQVAEFKQRLLDAGCNAAAMSGSGPTLFGLCVGAEEARTIAEAFTDAKTSVVCTVNCGVARV